MLKSKKAFTLIELIIVMAIIGILAIVAVVAVGNKSAEARDARRLNDMSAVKTAMALACADGDTLTMANNGSGRPKICLTGNNSYLSFSNIHDPHSSISKTCGGWTVGCTQFDDQGVCDYAYGITSTGGQFSAIQTTADPCDYWINFFQEGDDNTGHLRDEGLIE